MTTKNASIRIGLDPGGFMSGADRLSIREKKLQSQFEASERKWRGLQGQHQSALNEASALEAKVAAAAQKQTQARSQAYSKMMVVGALAAAAAGVAAKKYADFDQAVSGIKASGPDAAANIDKLRVASVRAGKDTQYSATEAANGVTELAKAGVSAADILSGGLDGALSLAAAGQMEVADAAAVTSKTLNQYELAGNDAAHVSDVLAAAAGKANGDVSDFGTALEYVGPQAHGMGVSLEETAGSLALLAQNGLLADKAGTGLRGVLVALAAPTSKAQKTLDEYGISAYDTQGKFVGVAGVAGQLKDKLGGLSQETQNAALKTIFSNAQLGTAQVLMRSGAEDVKTWTDAVNDQGFAAETAATKMDNLKGDLEKLGGSFETVLIQSGSGVNDVLREVVQSAGAVIDVVGEIPAPLLAVLTLIVGAGGLAVAGTGGVLKLAGAFKSAKIAAAGLGISMKSAAMTAGGVGAVVAIAAVGLSIWADKVSEAKENTASFQATLDEFGEATDATMSGINEQLAEGRGKWSDFLTGNDARSLIDQAKDLGLVAKDLQDYVLGNVDLLDLMSRSTNGSVVMTKSFSDGLGGLRDSLTDAERAELQKIEADKAAGLAGKNAAGATDDNRSALTKYTQAQQEGVPTTDDYTDALKEQIDAQRTAAGITLSARDAERGYQSSVDDAREVLSDYRTELVEKYKKQGKSAEAAKAAAAADIEAGKALDTGTEAGRKNQAALDGIADSAWDRIDSLRESGSSEDELREKMKKSRKAFIDTATEMGASKTKAKDLADQLGLIPERVTVDLQVDADVDAAKARVDALLRAIDNVSHTNYDPTGRKNPPPPATNPKGKTGKKDGGAVIGPGTGTSDSIHDVDLSNGEHVVPADEVEAAGGQQGMYRLRGALRAGTLAFKVGGAVGDAIEDRKAAKLAVDRAVAAAKAARRSETTSQKAYDGVDGTKANHAKKTSARSALAGAKQATKRSEKELAAARQGFEDAKAKIETLRGLKSDLSTDVRRGNITDSVTGDSGISIVDQMYDWASNDALSPKAQKRLGKKAGSFEKQLNAVYKQLDTAKEALADLQEVHNAVTGALSGEFSLKEMLGKTDALGHPVAVTAASVVSGGAAVRDRILAFGGKLKKLQEKGASIATLREVAMLGSVDGMATADALLADPSKIGQLNNIYTDIDRYSAQAGQYVTEGNGKGGLSAAQAAVDALTAQSNAIGQAMASSFADAIEFTVEGGKLKAKKKVKKAVGGWIVGQGHGTSDSVDVAASPGEFMVSAHGARINRAVLPAMNAGYRLPVMQPAPAMQASPAFDYDRLGASVAQHIASLPVRAVPVVIDKRVAQKITFTGMSGLRDAGATYKGESL